METFRAGLSKLIAPHDLSKKFPVIVLATVLICWIIVAFIRKTYFHPLSKFRGPWTAAFSNLNYSLSYLGGRQPYDVLKLHEKYGPVVRVAPNQLCFNSSQSWKDIYGPRKGHATFVKSTFYDGGNFADQAHSIVSERDPVKHSEMRRYLSSAFSDRSLREQEYLVAGVIDEFVEQIGKVGSKPEGVDLTTWFNLLTFDVIGELAFGESFGGVKSGKTHFWISVVLESMGQSSLSDFLQRFPLLGRIYLKLNPRWMEKLVAGSQKHESYTLELINRRIKKQTDRKDFMSYLLQNRDEYKISDIQLAAHASDFVIAGSETTATTLATVVYYLCRNGDVFSKLKKEIRSAFKSYNEINGTSASSLRYLHAVCLEALRIFPPLPLALPRIVPPGGDTVDGFFIPEGTEVATNPFAAGLDAANFVDPWKFDPDRWLGQNDRNQLEASQPFSLGTRACLGRSLGWLELRTTLAKVLFKYDLHLLDQKIDWQRDSRMHLLWKKPKLMVKVSPRAS
ncbi:hypothetical protein AJ79_09172 [Helicocarpus griseus UAMH5409]|uniref:Benzoate 4-monooxygenase cytochrome P450 n=1 Tax=Helicocarpus griseus UAMH5409 TaxID=1447875 RepID=A0A2B7WLK4_9EURO|nr:hypothetical protein AJ79_09172 [Helicocarpus griseus UAMH5409]